MTALRYPKIRGPRNVAGGEACQCAAQRRALVLSLEVHGGQHAAIFLYDSVDVEYNHPVLDSCSLKGRRMTGPSVKEEKSEQRMKHVCLWVVFRLDDGQYRDGREEDSARLWSAPDTRRSHSS